MHASERLLRTRPMFMVSIGVSKLGCRVVFVEPGVKINGAYYRDVLLTQKLLQVIGHISGNEYTCFSRTVLQHSVLMRL